MRYHDSWTEPLNMDSVNKTLVKTLSVSDFVILEDDVKKAGYDLSHLETIFSIPDKKAIGLFWKALRTSTKVARIKRIQKNGIVVLSNQQKIPPQEIVLAYRFQNKFSQHWYMAEYDKTLNPKLNVNRCHINVAPNPKSFYDSTYVESKPHKDDFHHYYRIPRNKDLYDPSKAPNSWYLDKYQPYEKDGERYYFTKESDLGIDYGNLEGIIWMRTREEWVPKSLSLFLNFPFSRFFQWKGLDNGTIKVSI
jgi:hypothetical protein